MAGKRIDRSKEVTFENVYMSGGTVTEAARVAGITRVTGYRIVERRGLEQARRDEHAKAVAAETIERNERQKKNAKRFADQQEKRIEAYEVLANQSVELIHQVLLDGGDGALKAALEIAMKDKSTLDKVSAVANALNANQRVSIVWVKHGENGPPVNASTNKPLPDPTKSEDGEIYLPDWARPFTQPARWKTMYGGRGSGKSWTAARLMILRMRGDLHGYGKPKPVRIISARDYNSSLQGSVRETVRSTIHQMGLKEEFKIMDSEIRHLPTGSTMIFMGVTRRVESFLSIENVDILWLEQAEFMQDEMIKVEPSIRKPGSEIWAVWNPDKRTDWVWDRFVNKRQESDIVAHVNFNDNPWFGDENEASRKFCEEFEPSLYAWTWEGQPNDGNAANQILPYVLLENCVKAWDLRPDSGRIHAGFDIAEGGRNKCAVTIRQGPSILHCEVWPGIAGDLDPAARRADSIMRHFGASRIYYDGASPMDGPLRRARKASVTEHDKSRYSIYSEHFGGEVRGPDVIFDERTSNTEEFQARNIQMATGLRLRAQNTYRLLNGDETVKPANCLFINPDMPDLQIFLNELTQPIRMKTSGLRSEWSMDKRGMEGDRDSPDRFDATCLAFAYDSEYGLTAR